ncbi:MAG TPA: hypothetical protein VI455_14450 [Terriglobia bacterium]
MQKRRTVIGYLLIVGVMLAASVVPGLSQTAAPASQAAGGTSSADEVALLKQQLAAQQKQLDQMQAAMAEMKKQLDRTNQGAPQVAAAPAAPPEPSSLGQVASLSPVIPTAPAASAPSLPAVTIPQKITSTSESPLFFKIGGASFTPGGFLDFTTFYRTTNVGSGIGTSFGSIPFSNGATGQLSETRFTMQNSRLSLDVNSMFKGFDLHAHVEADFLGFSPPNVFDSSNSNTLRSRLYWLDGRKGHFEFLGGQSWTMLTPNRTGLSANPSDIFYSQDMDTNYQVGLVWARQAQFRLIYHFTDTAAAGISIEDPQQFCYSATVPSSMVAQCDNGSGSITNSNAANNPATPNLMPDIISKVAFDPMMGKLHEHVEFAGVLNATRVYDPAAQVHNSAVGGGVAANFNLELFKNFHFVLNSIYGDGIGRYLFALAPNFVINRNGDGDYHPSLVHTGAGLAGFEYQANQRTMFYGYYGGVWAQRNFGIDCYIQPAVIPPPGTPPPTTPAPVVCNSTPSTKPSYLGYGYPGAPNSQNKSVQEPTFGIIETFWKNPHYGALQIITQYSYVTRAPWFVATDAPKNAHLSMAYVDLRYVIP